MATNVTSKMKKYTSPGGEKRISYHKKKHMKLKCAGCGKELLGVSTDLKKVSKSQRVPNRPYAGIYCGSCTRKNIKTNILERIKKLISGDKK